MTSSRSWSEAVLRNAMIYKADANRRSLTTSADNCPSTSIAGTYIYYSGDRSQFQSMQRVTICQDSTHLPSEPYVSYKIFEQIIYNNNNNNSLFTALPASNSTGQVVGVKCLKKSRHSSRLTPWKRCPKCSSLLHAREPENFGGGPIGCQNITAKNQSLREERSSTRTQHSNLSFKYQVGTSTPVSEQEPRHMGAPQYRLNCQEADI